MGFFKRLFREHSKAATLADVNEMAIESVWEEFCTSVRLRDGGAAIDRIGNPQMGVLLAWLEPPTDCPLAKGAMRVLVDATRNGTIADVDEVSMFYIADENSEDLAPPQASIHALTEFCSLFQVGAQVFYYTERGIDESIRKTVITVER